MSKSSREQMWKLFFPDEDLPELDDNALEKSQGMLRRLLPDNIELNLTEEVRKVRGKGKLYK